MSKSTLNSSLLSAKTVNRVNNENSSMGCVKFVLFVFRVVIVLVLLSVDALQLANPHPDNTFHFNPEQHPATASY